jgi:uncharacterized membrane protein
MMTKTSASTHLKNLTAYSLLAFFSYLMLLITLQYLPINLSAAFLKTKPDEIQLPYYQWTFFAHVFSSMVVLLAGFTQFSSSLRQRFVKAHRTVGKMYIGIVLFISGPTGLVMACHANGGPVAQISFCLLAMLWIFSTYKAYHAIRNKNIAAHRNWMYRSYALTLSAITLRLWKWGIVLLFELRPMDTYRIVAWLGWVLNLAVAEWLTYRFQRGNAPIV